MKKLLFSLLAGTLILSGCGQKEETPTTPAPTAAGNEEVLMEKKEAQKDMTPEELFYSLAQANLDDSVEMITENIPSKATFTKGERTFSATGNVNLAGTPAAAGTVDFTLSTQAQGDFSDTKNTKANQVIDFTASIKDAAVQGDASGKVEVRVVDNSLFASLQALEINSPMIPQEQIQMMTGAFIGQWYGNTFDELNALQSGAQQMDLQKLVAGTPVGVILWEMIEDEQANLKDYIEFVSMKEEKDGIVYFEAKQKTEKTAQFIATIADSFGLPTEVQEDMKKTIAAQKDQVITIGYKKDDSSFIYAQSGAINPETQDKIEGKMNTVIYSDTELSAEVYLEEEEILRVAVQDGKFSIGGDSKEKKGFTVITGTYSDTSFAFEAVDPDATSPETAEGEEAPVADKISGNFTKTGNTWAGEITNTMNPTLIVKISDASYSKEKITVSIAVVNGEYTYGPIALTHTMKAVDSVSVETPENAQSFEVINQMLNPQAAPAGIEG